MGRNSGEKTASTLIACSGRSDALSLRDKKSKQKKSAHRSSSCKKRCYDRTGTQLVRGWCVCVLRSGVRIIICVRCLSRSLCGRVAGLPFTLATSIWWQCCGMSSFSVQRIHRVASTTPKCVCALASGKRI